MVSVADLLKEPVIPGNYYAADAYVQGDFETGLIENRKGARLIALPDILLQAIYAGLDQEVGKLVGSCFLTVVAGGVRTFIAALSQRSANTIAVPLRKWKWWSFSSASRNAGRPTVGARLISM